MMVCGVGFVAFLTIWLRTTTPIKEPEPIAPAQTQSTSAQPVAPQNSARIYRPEEAQKLIGVLTQLHDVLNRPDTVAAPQLIAIGTDIAALWNGPVRQHTVDTAKVKLNTALSMLAQLNGACEATESAATTMYLTLPYYAKE